MLELREVTKRYDSNGADRGPAVLDKIDLRVNDGETVVITGPSGSGKSTLLNIAGALDRPNSGSVLLDGDDLALMDEKQLASVRNRRIGFVFQLHHLLPQCTALENVLVPTLVSRGDRNELQERAESLMQRTGLADHMDQRPGELSGGQRQRVALVRALINRPALVLADEPTGSLDRDTSDEMADLLVELNQMEQTTLVVVTHSARLAQRMGKQYELEEGKLTERTHQP
jgi:ABC-type lipoprotein export system ATPase subunit